MSSLKAFTYRVAFERIGARHEVAPLEVPVDAETPFEALNILAEEILRYARPRLGSRQLDVDIETASTWPYVTTIDGHSGRLIVGGCRTAGHFTVEATLREASAESGGAL